MKKSLVHIAFVAGFLPALVLLFSIQISQAGSATWASSPATNDWNTASNWSTGGPPNGPSDTATFATSNKTAVSLSAATQVSGTIFNAGASAFTITIPANNNLSFTMSGMGITNNSGVTQKFVAASTYMQFLNSATAGSSTRFTIDGTSFIHFLNTSTAGAGTFTLDGDPATGNTSLIEFYDNSTAGTGGFTLNGPATINFFTTSTAGAGTFILNAVGFYSSFIYFNGTSTAGAGAFTLNANVNGASSFLTFRDNSTAGNGVFTVKGGTASPYAGSQLDIDPLATAGHGTFTIDGPEASGADGATMFIAGNAGAATLIANAGVGGGYGGSIYLYGDSVGGTSRVEVFGNATGNYTDGNLDISGQNAPGVAIGSIEGSGSVFLGANKLTVGANNRSTIFSGIIADDPSATSYFGSLSKTGKGKLSLTNGNTYSGGTTISQGTLLAKNKIGSATGTGAVQVNAATLGGTGKISGAVTIGNGTTSGAILLPGTATKPGTLTINNTLRFNSLSTYKCVLNRATPVAAKVSALGVTISANVPFTFGDTTTGTLTPGTIFTVINNTSANPIAGTFSNLSNGSMLTSNGTNFLVKYNGGTGNDLTLTVQ